MKFSWRNPTHPINEWHDTLEWAVHDAVDAEDYDPKTLEYLYRDEDGIRVIRKGDQIMQYEIEEIARQIRGE